MRKTKYTIQFKIKVIGYAETYNIISAAQFYELSRNTVSKWVRSYRKEGIEGLIRKEKKKDNQKRKIDDATFSKIVRFKKNKPNSTLKEIKKHFNLDCSLTIISRKLNRFSGIKSKRDLNKFKSVQSFSVYINIISKAKIKGQIHTIYQINVEDNISHSKYIGYSLEKSSMNISLFIDYVLTRLKDKGKINNNYKIYSNIPYLKNQENDDLNIKRFVTSKHSTDLVIDKKLKTTVSNIGIESNDFSHKELIKNIYKEIILGKKEVSLKDDFNTENIIIPPIFVENFIKDLDKIVKFSDFWNTISIPVKQNNLLLTTICEIEKYGDKAQIDFDFNAALNIYHKIQLTCSSVETSGELKSQINLKIGKIYYHIDNFKLSKQVLFDNIELSLKYSLNRELAETYTYLGKISRWELSYDQAESYYNKAINIYLRGKEINDIVSFYQVSVRRMINIRNFRNALIVVDKLIQFTTRKNIKYDLLIALGLKGIVYTCLELNEKAEEFYIKKYNLAKSLNFKILEAESLIEMLDISTHRLKKEYKKIKKYFIELEELTIKIKKPSYLYQSLSSVGIYYYNNNNLKLANKLLLKAVRKGESENLIDYFVNYQITMLIYLGHIELANHNYGKAIRFYNKASKLCKVKGSIELLIYIENALGRTYFKKDNYDKAVRYLNKSIKNAISIGNEHIQSDSYRFLGEIYKIRRKYRIAIKYFKISLRKYFKLKEKNHKLQQYIDYIKLEIEKII